MSNIASASLAMLFTFPTCTALHSPLLTFPISITIQRHDTELIPYSHTLTVSSLKAFQGKPIDIIALTGDFVNRDIDGMEKLAAFFEKLVPFSRLGVFACLGNHDSYMDWSRDEITQILRAAKVNVLRNDVHLTDNEQLLVVGLEDYWNAEFWGHRRTMDSLDSYENKSITSSSEHKPCTRIVLSHNPDSAVSLRSYNFDIQLSGHTHGGQICLPISYGPLPAIPVLAIFRWILDCVLRLFSKSSFVRSKVSRYRKFCFVVNNWQWSQGLHVVDDETPKRRKKWMFVTRGIGSHKNMRLFCPPELALITFVRDKSAAKALKSKD